MSKSSLLMIRIVVCSCLVLGQTLLKIAMAHARVWDPWRQLLTLQFLAPKVVRKSALIPLTSVPKEFVIKYERNDSEG